MSSTLFPQFYLIRPESKQTATSDKVTYSIVPLIPADQLPERLEIVGVPRTLHHQQASKMSSVGIIPRDVGFYDVQITGSSSPPPNFSWAGPAPFAPVPITTEPEHDTSTSSSIHSQSDEIHREERAKALWNIQHATTRAGHRNDHGSWSLAVSDLVPSAEDRSVQDQDEDDMTTCDSLPSSPPIHMDATGSNDTITTQSTGSAPMPDSAEELDFQDISVDSIPDDQTPPPPSSESDQRPQHQGEPSRPAGTGYCLHWCIHGICKWGPRCRFLHQMPETPEEFRSVGLTGYPRWYIDLMRKLDFSKGPDHASKLLYLKANAAPQHCRARRKEKTAHLQDGSNPVLTSSEIKQAQAFAVSMWRMKKNMPARTARERRNYRQQGVRKSRSGEGGRHDGSMMEQLTRSLGGIDLGSGVVGDAQGASGLSYGSLVEPEKSPLYQRRPPVRTRGPRDHILVAAIGDGEPVALGGGKARWEGGDSSVIKSAEDGGKRMSKGKGKRELERGGKEKVAVKAVAKPCVGDVDLLTFSDEE